LLTAEEPQGILQSWYHMQAHDARTGMAFTRHRQAVTSWVKRNSCLSALCDTPRHLEGK